MTMEPHDDIKQHKSSSDSSAQLASPEGAARTVADELKAEQPEIEKPPVAGTVVDPAEVIPPVVPARRSPSKKWVLAAVIVVCAITVFILVAAYGG